MSERRKSRIGNNFYLVGYLCPACCGKLHMAVYPAGKEFKIETEEGGVLLARAATCNSCRRFYTPRPRQVDSRRAIFTRWILRSDDAAYDDYLELLGRNADRVSNYHTNVYADGRRPDTEEDGEESLEDLCNALPELSDLEGEKAVRSGWDEGFYPGRIQWKNTEAKSAAAGRESGTTRDALCRSGNRQRKNRISSLERGHRKRRRSSQRGGRRQTA